MNSYHESGKSSFVVGKWPNQQMGWLGNESTNGLELINWSWSTQPGGLPRNAQQSQQRSEMEVPMIQHDPALSEWGWQDLSIPIYIFIYVYKYMYVCIYIYIYLYICLYMCIYIYICICLSSHVFPQIGSSLPFFAIWLWRDFSLV